MDTYNILFSWQAIIEIYNNDVSYNRYNHILYDISLLYGKSGKKI